MFQLEASGLTYVHDLGYPLVPPSKVCNVEAALPSHMLHMLLPNDLLILIELLSGRSTIGSGWIA